MRTDAKIGILAGLVIAVVVIIYVFSTRDGKAEPETGKPEATELARHDRDRERFSPPNKTVQEAGEPFGQTEVVKFPGIGTPPKPEAKSPEMGEKTAEIARKTGMSFEKPKTEPLLASESKLPVEEMVQPVLPPRPVEKTPAPVPPRAAQPYAVQAGDLGFWGIAAKVYKDGSKWRLIADANPKADSNNLRPGQKLLIPPLPQAEPKLPRQEVEPGKTFATEAGQTIYVVQKGDAGFWGIAAKQYRDGSKWYLIRNANPNVDPRRLQPGMRLIIPPLAEARRPGEVRTATTEKPTPRKTDKYLEIPKDGRPRFYDVLRAES
jgi:nucleoid-associated protein YgaU